MNEIVDNPIFTTTFKKYKNSDYVLNYEEIISFNKEYSDIYLEYNLRKPKMICPLGVLPIQQWKSYYLNQHPGLIIISNIFSETFQKYIVMKSLENYINEPNKTNLNISSINVKELWKEYKKDPVKKIKDIKKLRWATMGFHHNWDTKIYNLSEQTAMPKEITDCCKYIACAVGYDNYNPEASIVNFYHRGNTLSGHTDHSEQDQKSPIISISFGCSAIFMIGGESKEDKCSAILIKNGDVVIMSKHSRLCYHAVPKIITGTYVLHKHPASEKNLDHTYKSLKKSENSLKLETNNLYFEIELPSFSEKSESSNNIKELQESMLSVSTDTKFCKSTNESTNPNSNDNMHLNNLINIDEKLFKKMNETIENNLNYTPDLNKNDLLNNLSIPNKKCEISLEEIIDHYDFSNEIFKSEDIKRFKCDDTKSLLKYDWNIYYNFLLNARININVRQVRPNIECDS